MTINFIFRHNSNGALAKAREHSGSDFKNNGMCAYGCYLNINVLYKGLLTHGLFNKQYHPITTYFQ